jgi:hypothetical protein
MGSAMSDFMGYSGGRKARLIRLTANGGTKERYGALSRSKQSNQIHGRGGAPGAHLGGCATAPAPHVLTRAERDAACQRVPQGRDEDYKTCMSALPAPTRTPGGYGGHDILNEVVVPSIHFGIGR